MAACHCVSIRNQIADIVSPLRVLLMQYPAAIELVSEGRVRAKATVTHNFGFKGIEDVVDGFKCALHASETKAIKVMYNINPL